MASRSKITELLELLTEEQRKSLRAYGSSRDGSHRRADVAIIGLSGRYPQSDDHYDFWRKLQQGVNFIQELPASRWTHEEYFRPGMDRSFVPHQTRCKFGAFINEHDAFDSDFFELQPEEVPMMDPQERLALETIWSCIEDAGYVPGQLGAEVGVFSGLTYSDYQKLIPLSTHLCMLNSRVAYFFNFRGPTVTCDTGCSSSLTAIHLACQSLLKRDCRAAVVLGANLLLHPDHFATASPQLSASLLPRSNPFGTDDGWIPAEAVVSVLLKPLPQALEDGDHVYAVIKSTHISQEGKTSWFSAPSPKRQAELIEEHFEKAGINPETISYVEAAANGSSLGDAIEVEGLASAFGRFTDRKQFCPIGSVKSNVGHGEGVSTLLQLTKVLLQFKSQALVPLINLKETNPNIAIENTPFYFETSPAAWNPPRVEVHGREFILPRRATISSFGAGGNLGHLILEEHEFEASETASPDCFYIPLSSQSAEQLRETVESYSRFFQTYWAMDARGASRYSLLNIMFTLCIGRVPHKRRVVFVARNLDELLAGFRGFTAGESDSNIIQSVRCDGSAVDPAESLGRPAWRELAERWVMGQDVNWRPFFDRYLARRVSLPTCRFRRQRFPIPKPGVFPLTPTQASFRPPQATTSRSDTGIKQTERGSAGEVFKEIFGKAVSVPAHEIDLSLPLDRYGFDSTMVVHLARELEGHFPVVPKTLFFECRTLAEVIDYFSRKFPVELQKLNPRGETAPAIVSDPAPARSRPAPPARSRDIAVIGIAGRYPGANTINRFWENLRQGRDSVSEIPPDRWPWREYFCGDSKKAGALGKSYSKWGGFIDDIDKFDALFFSITPREAELMDPQERIFLEVAWAALEDAGYTPASLKQRTTRGEAGKAGVFVGVSWQEYQSFSGRGAEDQKTYFLNHAGSIANRVSYICNFEGTSLTTDTACSSALTAIHLACSSLIQGTDALALAGGVNLSLLPNKYVSLSSVGMISSKGRCGSFGEGGDGYTPGEGVGCIVLKPLEDAVADRDHIYGVIKGSAINHGGKTNGYSVPNPQSQARVIEEAIRASGINPRTIGCIEAHGTGTSLGDPIEIAGLTKAFSNYTGDKQFCAIGSVKSNIGHAESAAGIAGLTKALLQLQHAQLAPSLHSESLNADIDFSQTPFFVQRELAPWKPVIVDGQTVPRRIGVSSFGAGGANAHVILEEYVPPEGASIPRITGQDRPALIVLSAKNADRLNELVRNLLGFVKDNPLNDSLDSLAYTLQVGREAMPERMAMPVTSRRELVTNLEMVVNGQEGVKGLLRSRAARGKTVSTEAIEKAFEAWLATGFGDELLRLWVQGVPVDWNRLYGDSKPHRISLPAYPFARERHWVGGAGANSEAQPVATLRETGTLLCPLVWKDTAVSARQSRPDFAERLVILCEIEAPAGLSGARCLTLKTNEQWIAGRFEAYAIQAFEQIQAVLRESPRQKTFIQIVVPSVGEPRLFCGLSGLLDTAHLENPNCFGQLIEVDPDIAAEELAATLFENSARPEDVHVRYRDGRRLVAAWEEANASRPGHLPWKDGGVYLITGGAGGLGLIFAREIANKTQNATLILAGRSPCSHATSRQFVEIESSGALVEYVRVDVGDKDAVAELVRRVVARYGSLNAVIHSAGVIRDSYILKKTAEEIREVLSAKVGGTLYLDLATRDLDLDFFTLFSSVAGAVGNVGQADYATANAFMDAFAEYRSELVSASLRRGLTVSINWPLWEKGGMKVDDGTRTKMTEGGGLMAMDTPDGIQALETVLAMQRSNVMVLFGDLARMRTRLAERVAPRAASLESGPRTGSGARSTNEVTLRDGFLLERIQARLKNMFGAVTKIPADRIDALEPLETYGLDSIIITRLNHELAGIFGEIPQTLFFECQSLGELAAYFVENNPLQCRAWVRPAVSSDSSAVRVPDEDLSPRLGSMSLPIDRRGKRNVEPAASVDEPIAIIGISGRYAGADNLDTFWDHLQSGRDCITEIAPERWPLNGFYHDSPEEAIERGMSYSKWGSFLEGFADFDPLFFNISPLEAMSMDPQERLFLQAAWEVFEDAGYTRASLARRFDGKVGVFAGITKTGFDLYRLEKRQRAEPVRPRTSFSSVANRISYVMNLRGPSMPIDTMCSSSLTAIHEACEHLRHGACEMAVAGGVNLYLHPTNYFDLCAHQMLSPDGRCRSFGVGANGFVPGEGVGVVLLKPLWRAIEDRDPIHAVIRATSVNHGGKTNGYTVPNPKAQAALIREALDKAQVHARTVSYVEAHGTGTELGDPIEVAGLTQAFRKDTKDAGFCALGSVKSNLGHLEAAAGIAGLTKVILQMKHKRLVPSLHAVELNPKIRFAATPFVVQQEVDEWKRPILNIDGDTKAYPRIAGISSFGAGGSNAHVIVEEYIADQDGGEPPARVTDQPALIVLSAKDEERLKEVCENLHAWLIRHAVDLADIAYTLQVGREPMEERLAFVVESVDELTRTLRAFIAGEEGTGSLYRGSVQRRNETLTLLSVDQDMAKTVRAWIAKRQYSKLLKLWAEGFDPDWDLLYGEVKPRRISLPAYPFARERFWVTGGKSNARAAAISIAKKSKASEPAGGRLYDRVLGRLKDMLEEFVALPAARIDSQVPLHAYGADSVITARFTQRLESAVGALPQTLLYEYPTLASVAGYLIVEHAARCAGWVGLEDLPAAVAAVRTTVQPTPPLLNHQPGGREPIAIVGMSGRFARSDSLSEFWQNLSAGTTCITEIPEDRWSLEGFFEPDPQRAMERGMCYGKWGGFLRGFAEFDPLFFNISPREALEIDPQERLFLQECWRALEDAGYPPSRLDPALRKRFGVYGGITQLGEGTSAASLVNRVSHALDFLGPSMPVDAMCSSALVALHHACETLRHGDIDAALVGAVNLYLRPSSFLKLARARMISDSAIPAVFGRGGIGFTPSEGVGVVVIKRLSDAERDCDNILAVIRGSAVNHNGKATAYTVPNPRQQEDVIRQALENGNVDPRTVGYIESAANGSEMGDAIEMTAIANVFRGYRDDRSMPYRVGSLKSTIGHGEAVSGMAQLMKVVLQLQHETLCPTPVPNQPNPAIDFENLPFSIQTQTGDWTRLVIQGQPVPRRAGISSVGAGGVNAHIIVEEYGAPAVDGAPVDAMRGSCVFVLSARTARVLEDYLEIWKRYVTSHPDLDLARVAYTLQTGREAMKYRFACVVNDVLELLRCIQCARSEPPSEPVQAGAIESWIEAGDLERLARAWAGGATVPWHLLHRNYPNRPLSGLPLYPFVRKSYRSGPAVRNAPIPTDEPRFIPFLEEDADSSRLIRIEEPASGSPAPPSRTNGDRSGALSVDAGDIRKTVRSVLSEVLYFDEQDEVDDVDNFFDLGLNSVSIVTFVQRLNRSLNLSLRETIAFDYPNISALSKHIVSETGRLSII